MTASSSPRAAASKLRYAAYEPPPAATAKKGLFRRTSSASSAGSRVEVGSPRAGMRALSPLVTPGDLALAGAEGDVELEVLAKVGASGILLRLADAGVQSPRMLHVEALAEMVRCAAMNSSCRGF